MLQQWRVWDWPWQDSWAHPVFSAKSEWFYATPEVGQLIRAYIQKVR
jgi:hypothetical protein